MNKENRIGIWLTRSMEMETRGRALYLDAAKKAADPAASDFFKMLADQELIHLKIIKDIYDSRGDGRNPWDGRERLSDMSGLNEVFRKITAKKIPAGAGILESIDRGLAFEAEVRDYYAKEVPLAEAAEEKDFLARLAAEENAHFQMLSDMKLYYSDPEAWNEQQDNIHLDGV